MKEMQDDGGLHRQLDISPTSAPESRSRNDYLNSSHVIVSCSL